MRGGFAPRGRGDPTQGRGRGPGRGPAYGGNGNGGRTQQMGRGQSNWGGRGQQGNNNSERIVKQRVGNDYQMPYHGREQVRTLKCLYSHQKLKKKKMWMDGELKVSAFQRKCILYKIAENSSVKKEILESKYCPDDEIDRILNGIADSFEFEKYLVQIEQTPMVHQEISNSSTDLQPAPINKIQQLTSKLKQAPFKIPQRVVPVIPEKTYPADKSGPTSATDSNSRKRGFYCIDEEELDDIWDSTHNHNKDQQNHHQNPSHNYPSNSSTSFQNESFAPGKSNHSLGQVDFNIHSNGQRQNPPHSNRGMLSLFQPQEKKFTSTVDFQGDDYDYGQGEVNGQHDENEEDENVYEEYYSFHNDRDEPPRSRERSRDPLIDLLPAKSPYVGVANESMTNQLNYPVLQNPPPPTLRTTPLPPLPPLPPHHEDQEGDYYDEGEPWSRYDEELEYEYQLDQERLHPPTDIVPNEVEPVVASSYDPSTSFVATTATASTATTTTSIPSFNSSSTTPGDTNIWSRYFDSSQIGFVDESSN